MKKIIISLCSLAFITTLTSCAVPLQELGDNSKKAIDTNVLTDAVKIKLFLFSAVIVLSSILKRPMDIPLVRD